MSVPNGFKFSGVTCGLKESGTLDLALIATDSPCVVAGVYTQNVVRAASIDWNRSITPSANFRAVVINSGNANACTGDQGAEDNLQMAREVAQKLGAKPEQICVLSTGVIGHMLPMKKVSHGIETACKEATNSQENFELASEAIMTTDKGPKRISTVIDLAGEPNRRFTLAGFAKGAGMIGPNMATMLAVITTDAKLSAQDAQNVLQYAADHSFNRISVEGHTSTNDALLLICNGDSGVEISEPSDLERFRNALTTSCIGLAKKIPSDGEGATHLVEIQISGAVSDAEADRVARTIAASALVKTAITGADPNWGRIVSAAGYSGAEMSVDQTELKLNGHIVFQSGQPISFDEKTVSQAMASQFETTIELKIGSGPGSSTHWTSDLTVDYVKFNSEYTT